LANCTSTKNTEDEIFVSDEKFVSKETREDTEGVLTSNVGLFKIVVPAILVDFGYPGSSLTLPP
jgi:hypothetical protein